MEFIRCMSIGSVGSAGLGSAPGAPGGGIWPGCGGGCMWAACGLLKGKDGSAYTLFHSWREEISGKSTPIYGEADPLKTEKSTQK